MRKEKGSLTFWLTVCVLVICVAMARDNGSTSKAKGSTDVVYPDYYAKTSDDLDTTNTEKAHRNTKTSTKKEDTVNVNIEEEDIPLADTITDETPSAQNTTPKISTVTPTSNSTTLPITTSVLDRKSQILSDMAQSSALINTTQTLANAVVAAKTAKYQAVAAGVALGTANIHNQKRAAVLDLVESRQKAHTDTVNKIISQTRDTTKDVLNTALTIHNDINQIHNDLKQNADKIHGDIKDKIDEIHKTHDEIKDVIDNLPHLPLLPDFPR